MATLTVRLPRMLSGFTDGRMELEIEGDTLAGALAALTARYPALGVLERAGQRLASELLYARGADR